MSSKPPKTNLYEEVTRLKSRIQTVLKDCNEAKTNLAKVTVAFQKVIKAEKRDTDSIIKGLNQDCVKSEAEIHDCKMTIHELRVRLHMEQTINERLQKEAAREKDL